MRKMEKKSKNKNGKEKKKTAKKSENKGGRPSSVTPETLAKLEQAFSLGCSDLEACIYADVVLKARTVVAEALKNKDENTAKWYLERKARDEFAAKQEVAVGNLESSPFKIEIVD